MSEAMKARMRHWLEQIRHAHDPQHQLANRSPWLPVLRAWQAGRLSATYTDLQAQPRFTAACNFFLSDLYGEQDFSQRDRDVERIFPVMVRLLPEAVLGTVAVALELNGLSHLLDLRMAARLDAHGPPGELDELRYAQAYAVASDVADRRHQLALILALGRGLDRIVQKRMVRELLALCHWPAKLAGLGALQSFLERGFAAFTELQGAGPFLRAVADREHAFMRRMLELGGLRDVARAQGPGLRAQGPGPRAQGE
ncbi:MAG: hypothetical protein KDI51_07615 [Xanthomonadales bacterium]|nr:hypothetical protein [Xanthomonadales bacterium]